MTDTPSVVFKLRIKRPAPESVELWTRPGYDYPDTPRALFDGYEWAGTSTYQRMEAEESETERSSVLLAIRFKRPAAEAVKANGGRTKKRRR